MGNSYSSSYSYRPLVRPSTRERWKNIRDGELYTVYTFPNKATHCAFEERKWKYYLHDITKARNFKDLAFVKMYENKDAYEYLRKRWTPQEWQTFKREALKEAQQEYANWKKPSSQSYRSRIENPCRMGGRKAVYGYRIPKMKSDTNMLKSRYHEIWVPERIIRGSISKKSDGAWYVTNPRKIDKYLEGKREWMLRIEPKFRKHH